MKKNALISDCSRYRYALTRSWDTALPELVIVMLNPSTADAENDDPTIRRCISFAKGWGYGGIVVVNLFAYRATDPKALQKNLGPVFATAEHNLRVILACARGRDVMVAWGAWASRFRATTQATLDAIHKVSKSTFCLGTTGDGQPKHPLYVKGSAERIYDNLNVSGLQAVASSL